MSSPDHLVDPRRLSQTQPAAPISLITSNERFPSFDAPRSNERLETFASPEDISTPQQPPPKNAWSARRSSQRGWANGSAPGPHKHKSRRSVSEALDNFRTRRGSVSENAQELAEALKAPVSYRLIGLCVAWYMTSALTNTSSKSILNAFPKPVTLTIVQFACVSSWCLVLAYLASVFPSLKISIPALKNGIRYPSAEVLTSALPLAVFQLLGHLLSSFATSRIPVSQVHTIKGLSPLFTVLAYRVVFRIRYARATYLSLVPLTVGVMLACSTDFSANFLGTSCAFVAALVFVTQNIFSKKIFTEVSRAEADGRKLSSRKLDKLNLLCYCSGGAFILTTPVWLLTEGLSIIGDIWHNGSIGLSAEKGSLDHGALLLEFIFNGIFHFGQNILAFVLLSMLSPVSYSVASLIKRVWVIIVAILWFRNATTPIQAFGIGLTFFGLYLYDRTSMDDAAERRAKSDFFRGKTALLPVNELSEQSNRNGPILQPWSATNGLQYEFPGNNFKKEDGPADSGRQRANSHLSNWRPPGTKQESTWEPGDSASKS